MSERLINGISERSIIECLCSEYQSVWVVDAQNGRLELFKGNQSVISEEAYYENDSDFSNVIAWYIEHFVAETDAFRVRTETRIDVVLRELSENSTYIVGYSRVLEETVNYNQIVFSRLEENDDEICRFLLGFREIDRRKKSDIDELTGVYTRQAFFKRARLVLEENPDEVFDIMISDIVDFKQINEMYGIQTGDLILSHLGHSMVPENQSGTVVGRYAGDQFVALIKHDKMKRLRNNPEALIVKPDEELPKYVIKFGIYEHADRKLSIVSMCDQAHIALNSIKHQYGSWLAVYDDKLSKELDIQRRIEASMHQALAEEQFCVYYQPKHETATGKIIGAEALIRWTHPEYGFMSPGDFIPIFEKTGFVTETDKYVWKKTCENIRKWIDKGINVVPVSVNASRLDFVQTDITKTLDEYVKQNKLSPGLIHVEVTESLMEEDMNRLRTSLSDVKKSGYKIELDDFGAGYSSLNVLGSIPIDVVKLDMSFVKQLNDTKRAKVLSACINLAKNLGYETVSEGVETREQHELLRIFGVDGIQGYYYSKPLPEEEFEEYLKKHAV